MSLRVVLEEQIKRNNNNIKAYMRKISEMPKGTIHEKNRGNKVYYYLKYRNNEGKRVDQYVRGEDVAFVIKQLKKRSEYMKIVSSLKEDIQVAQKGLK